MCVCVCVCVCYSGTICVYIEVYGKFKTSRQKNKHGDDVCREKYIHRKTRTCSRKYPLHLVKFTDSDYYYFFFSQFVFKIMKVLSLKIVTNMYRDLRSECASEYR